MNTTIKMNKSETKITRNPDSLDKLIKPSFMKKGQLKTTLPQIIQLTAIIMLLLVAMPIQSQIIIGGPGGGGNSSYSMSGSSNVNVGETHTYTITGDTQNAVSVSWPNSNSNFQVLSTSGFSATIKFLTVGNLFLSASVQENPLITGNSTPVPVSVFISVSEPPPANPNNPTMSTNCGQATLIRSGTPPSDIRWYWQGKSSSGTSTSLGYGSTFNANQGNGWYYIRARRNSTGQWSNGYGAVYVSIKYFNAGSINGTQTICYAGDPSTLGNASSPTYGSGGYTYQWQYSNNNINWANISGATSSTYNPPGGLTINRWYRRRVVSCGSQTKYTGSVKVTVRANLNAGSIAGVSNICYGGDPSTLGNSASPTGGNGSYTYQWQISSNGSSGWSNISGATASTYNPPGGLTSSKWYRRRVISCGQTKYSNTRKVTVYSNLSAGAIGGTQTICYGGDPNTLANSTSPSGGNGSYIYQWQYSNNNSSWSNISGATASTYNPPSGLTADRWYRRRVISCGQTKHTGSLKVTVNGNLSAGAIGGTQTICYSGDPNTLANSTSPSGGNGSYTYQWQYSNNNSSWSNISGATASTYNPPSGLTADRWYRRRVISCGQTKHTGSLKVTVYSNLSAGSINGTTSVCYNGDPGTLGNSASPSGGNGSYAYQWQISSNGSSGWSNISGATASTYNPPGGMTASRWYRRRVISCSQTKYTGTVKVTVYGNLSAGSINGTTSVCYGGDPATLGNSASPSGGNGSYTYQWQLSANGSSGWSNISGATASTYNPPGGMTASRWYRRSTNSCGQTKYTGTVKVTVYGNLSPGSINGTQTIAYNGDPSTLGNSTGPSGGNGSYTYQWQLSSNGSNGWSNISGATASTYNPPSGLTADRWYRRSANSCGQTKYTGSIKVTVLPVWYADFDKDGFGDPGNSISAASAPEDYIGNSLDNCPDIAGGFNGCTFASTPYTPVTKSDANYVYTRNYQTDGAVTINGHIIEQITYLDGLGRPTQNISAKATTDGKDIVTYMKYDQYGRQTKEYLPYATTSGAIGSHRTNDQLAAAKTYYNQKYAADFAGMSTIDMNPYSEQDLEASPLNRVMKQAAPGKDWKMGSGHEIEFDYRANTANEVRYYRVNLAADYTPTLVGNGSTYYQPGEVYKTITRDENHDGTTAKDHTSEEFKDQLGRVVLKRAYESEVLHDTYYVYDDDDNLTYVLPPKVNTADGISTTELNELCYQYRYDGRNRLVEKKIPGKGWEYIVYNRLDQPVMTQDANLRAQNKWLFTTYDALGRVAFTGIDANNTSTRIQVQQSANNATSTYVTKTTTANVYVGTTIYYNKGSNFPSSFDEVLTINYYDDYTFDNAGLNIPNTVQGQATTTAVDGLPTGSKVRVLGTNDWITTVTGYDEKGRAIYVASKNTYLNTEDVAETRLDFAGKVLQATTTHTKGSNAPIVTVDTFTYDHMARVIKQSQRINNNPPQIIARNTYDELGQLVRKDVGGVHSNNAVSLIDIVKAKQNNELIESTITANGWGNSGFATLESISGDGYVEFEVTATNEYLMVGLSVDNPNENFNSIDYAIYPRSGGELRVYENGSHKGTFGTFTIGDILKIERIGSTVYYKKNNSTFYTSTINSTANLMGDVAFNSVGSSIKNFKIVNASSQNNGSSLQNVDYTYNVRGWLKDINDVNNIGNDLFSFKIDYNTGTNALFNGNIAKTSWRTANTDNNLKSYDYSYDALNRITSGLSNVHHYNLSYVTYDKNGNIQTLKRHGWQNSTNYWDMDILTYQYDNGNKLTKVTDAGNGNYGFKDGANQAIEYEYDANGNMTQDLNKGIQANGITYNHLNLPTKVTVNGGGNNGTIDYIYDATGVKLEKKVTDGGSLTTTAYAGNFIYKNGNLEFFSHPEGYIEPNGNDFTYYYQLKDHLRNNRVNFKYNEATVQVEITEENNYYPFGLKHKGYNSVQVGRDHTYEYNGAEMEEALGLNMMEMEMRQYNPAIARWVVNDPVTHHSLSPYNAFDNNPVFWADPSGADSQTFTGMAARDAYRQIVYSMNNNTDSNDQGDGEEDCCPGLKKKLSDFADQTYGKILFDTDIKGELWFGEDNYTYHIQGDNEFYRIRRNSYERVDELPASNQAIQIVLPQKAAAKSGIVLMGAKASTKQTMVYLAKRGGKVIYVGITNNFARRAVQHLKGPHKLKINQIDDALESLSRNDARAVEQVLIEYFGLGGKRGQTGQLLNRINSISEKNKKYGAALKKGKKLLETAGFTF
ncbi:DUF6443 domain-containing protein [Spongiivirga citrea]|uniref:DUF6443 domain-containing protein n=1 Tax=Spongiivirga citrea TaxID=1481457 RepID=A0A6M0CSD1_9FLAO|nr:DUF6443 domain-containing protein [Spongiivirga citrea]NER16780.1 hypothetical protein [Spongiivirga citrea]